MVQTHWRPTRNWGPDPGKGAVIWVDIRDDGAYVFDAEFSRATPVTAALLGDRINRSIAADIAALRDFRSESG